MNSYDTFDTNICWLQKSLNVDNTVCLHYENIDSCNAYVTCPGGAWFGFLSSLVYNENMPLKHPMSEKI